LAQGQGHGTHVMAEKLPVTIKTNRSLFLGWFFAAALTFSFHPFGLVSPRCLAHLALRQQRFGGVPEPIFGASVAHWNRTATREL